MSIEPEELFELLSEDECLLADGFEGALIGFSQQFNKRVALYDWDKCIQILMERDGMTEENAFEYFEFNTLGAWMGDSTPAFARLIPQGSSMITILETASSSVSSETQSESMSAGN